jgi:hypothetical protein
MAIDQQFAAWYALHFLAFPGSASSGVSVENQKSPTTPETQRQDGHLVLGAKT